MNNFKGKNLGKYLICFIILVFTIYADYKTYEINVESNTYASGTVVGKNDAMTSGKYPKQYFIIAFDFDDPKYIDKDINVSFYTWNKLKVGDRAAFEYHRHLTFFEVVCLGWTLLSSVTIVVLFMFWFFSEIGPFRKIWNY